MSVPFLYVRSGELSPDVHHAAGGFFEAGLADVVAGFLLADDGVDVGDQFSVGIAGAHASGEVVVEDGEEAGTDLAVGGEANPAAMPAEGMRDGGDDADLADAIVEAEAARGFAALMFDLDQRFEFVHLAQNLVESDHHFR